MTQGKLGLCVVGLGRAGSIHLGSLQSLTDVIDVVAVCDEIPERAREMAERYGTKYYTSYAEALADPRIVAVDICLPHDAHCPTVVQAAKAGKHVIVEKPMANTTEEADAMIAAAEEAGVTLMVGQSRRFFPAVMESKRLVDEGKIGRLIHVHAAYFGLMEKPQSSWWSSASRTGGLMLALWGGHIVDYLLWLFGRKPSRVYMEASNNNPLWEGEDELAITLGFDDGAIGTAVMSWNARPVSNVAEASRDWGAAAFSYERFIVGREGTLQLRDERELFLNGSQVLADKDADNFAIELREFATAIREGRKPIASGREVRPVVEVLEACRRSATERRVIELA